MNNYFIFGGTVVASLLICAISETLYKKQVDVLYNEEDQN